MCVENTSILKHLDNFLNPSSANGTRLALLVQLFGTRIAADLVDRLAMDQACRAGGRQAKGAEMIVIVVLFVG